MLSISFLTATFSEIKELDADTFTVMVKSSGEAEPKPTPSPSKVANPLSYLNKRLYDDLKIIKRYTDEEINTVLFELAES